LKYIKIIASFALLTNIIFADAQDNLHEHIENGKFYGIFPVTENFVGYTDSLALIGSLNKDSLYDKAKVFFEQKEDANYYFESEDRETGELVYQGELNKGILSDNPDVHFSVALHFLDSICTIRLFEIVIVSKKEQYSSTVNFMNRGVPMNPGTVKTGVQETPTQLENITIGKGEFSKRYCEKINNRFISIVNGLRTAFL